MTAAHWLAPLLAAVLLTAGACMQMAVALRMTRQGQRISGLAGGAVVLTTIAATVLWIVALNTIAKLAVQS